MGDENLKQEIKQGCLDKSMIAPEFVRHCVMDMAGTDMMNKLNEVHLAVAAHISDKLVDRAIDSLMKCHKQLNDVSKKRSSTPDVLKTRLRASPSELSKEISDAVTMMNENSISQLMDQSPTATPQMKAKRKGIHGRRIRPKSVVDCVEGISADDIPDLLPSLPKTIEETISSLQDLPPVSPQQLKHLGKARPRKPKTRAPTRPCLRPPTELMEVLGDLQEGLDTFFRPGSTTPTPIVTPDSDECSTSLMISMASTADDSIQSTPTHSSRTFKVDDDRSDKSSPGSFDSCSIASKSLDVVIRSKSTDCLEKPSSNRESLFAGSDDGSDGQKSPVQRLGVTVGSSVLAEMKARQGKRSSGFFGPGTSKGEETPAVTNSLTAYPSTITTGVSVSETKEKFTFSQKTTGFGVAPNISRKPPPVAPKPRPWSVVGADRRSGEYSLGSDGSSPNASAANTPDSGELLDDSADQSGNVSPSALNATSSHGHNCVMDKFSALTSSISSSVEAVSLPTASSSQSNHLIINQNQAQPVSLVSPLSGGNIHAVSGAICVNLRNSSTASNGNENVGFTNHSISPASFPSWVSSDKRSVRELAASLARHQSSQESDPKKKADSLPRNVPSSSIDQQPDFDQARVSIQEWSRHDSVQIVRFGEFLSISKRWDPNNKQNSANRKGLRKFLAEEDVVNV
ncbi:unnamed protein product [Allacma fusca]|uniref:CARMIL C-terminal domain-containing protein n=1 Tax=Allacma fusca TaxID=39272 RepID=A0A8J2KIZ9_9HEXA|nr:unnamed protein product [Allacma fusca]